MAQITYGSPTEELIKYEQYLAFTNEDMTDEILRNSEGLEYAAKFFVDKYLPSTTNEVI
ncbi:MAG TPA: hypothetical protein VE619_05295 [Nitrososphaeraceae archaeon]|nr:hypothetical protein [Nitrososphaeraceae archaeon]